MDKKEINIDKIAEFLIEGTLWVKSLRIIALKKSNLPNAPWSKTNPYHKEFKVQGKLVNQIQ